MSIEKSCKIFLSLYSSPCPTGRRTFAPPMISIMKVVFPFHKLGYCYLMQIENAMVYTHLHPIICGGYVYAIEKFLKLKHDPPASSA